ncbi:hypothetical protein RHGRI_000985 [Rhododendron griersonianum]|uniref:Ion transport domain-containing protein n=1 Tax=Rhododendron griersonianum TaxID=479676 RepID=A0AAV6LKS8_9ERIC|nr:hypothetical protein RHGRI_000985 [Rhododendron griersonianum]
MMENAHAMPFWIVILLRTVTFVFDSFKGWIVFVQNYGVSPSSREGEGGRGGRFALVCLIVGTTPDAMHINSSSILTEDNINLLFEIQMKLIFPLFCDTVSKWIPTIMMTMEGVEHVDYCFQISYLVMFAYISLTLGDTPRFSSFYISFKPWALTVLLDFFLPITAFVALIVLESY